MCSECARSFVAVMAPKAKAKAKAKALAKARSVEVKNERRSKRQDACRALNTLSQEVCLGGPPLCLRNPVGSVVEPMVRLLERRALTEAQFCQLRNAVELFQANGGVFTVPLQDPNEVLPASVPKHRVLQSSFELKSKAFMLTYNGLVITADSWTAFRAFVVSLKEKFGARAWAACLEKSLNALGSITDRYHLHAYLLWVDRAGVHCRDLTPFVFQGLRPRVDVCESKAATTSPHSAACHGLWYVSLMKTGTVVSDTNYQAGVWYHPQAQWLQQLYQNKKLTYHRYLEISATDFPVGHASRKRDALEALGDRKAAAVDRIIKQELESLREDGEYAEPQAFDVVDRFVSLFTGPPHWRRPFLVIVGATNLGKSMLAATVLEKVASALRLTPPAFAEVTVEDDGHLDFSDLNEEVHSGVLFDGVGDAMILKKHRESLQGRPKCQKGARSNTMRYAYKFTLTRRAVVVTLDLSAANLHLLSTDHWLSDERNVLQLWLTSPAWQGAADDGHDGMQEPAVPSTAGERMQTWTVNEVVSFLHSADLAGPAATFFTNGVSGSDLAGFTLEALNQDLKLTKFAAGKVLAARDTFLQA